MLDYFRTIPDSPAWRNLLKNPGPTGHIVQLYQDENFFGDAVSHFAAEGLVKNESIIIVATGAHWENIAARLYARSFDVAELARRGQLTLLDADATLPTFLIDGMPDAKTFKSLARSTIRHARAGGHYPKVRWWGEMVNLLYVAGNVEGSIRLEELFDEVAREEVIAIFCSFFMDKFDPSIYDGPLQKVCRAHGHLIPAENYERHRECVERAMAEVLEGFDESLLGSVAPSIDRPGTQMPSSQALLLWLKEAHPDMARQVLVLARRYENDSVAEDFDRR